MYLYYKGNTAGVGEWPHHWNENHSTSTYIDLNYIFKDSIFVVMKHSMKYKY